MKLSYSIPSIILMMTIVSFLGFVVENVWLAFTKGYMDNRNMTLPFLLGYGVAIIGLYLLLGTPENSTLLDRILFLDTPFKRTIFYFICSFFFVCIAEIILGTFIEKTCHIILWNYSRFSLHITKYTSLPTSNGFALIITFFMDKCFTPIMDILSSIDYETAKDVSSICLGLMLFDFIINSVKIFKRKSFNNIWKINFKQQHDDEKVPT